MAMPALSLYINMATYTRLMNKHIWHASQFVKTVQIVFAFYRKSYLIWIKKKKEIISRNICEKEHKNIFQHQGNNRDKNLKKN